MPNYAVVDLGSNSIRLVVYDVKDAHKRTCTNKDFKSLINDKVMAGLSAYVVDGVFTQDGIDRAVSVLRGHAKRARYFDCEKMEVFATAVIRNALNCEEAVAAIEEAAELPISLLSATDEAHLGFVGATCDRTVVQGTLVDIGGGSTELTRIEHDRDFDNASIGQGSLSSFAQHVRGILPTGAEMDAIAACFIGGTAVTGGIGTIPGAVIGAFVMGVINQGLSIMGVDTAVVKTIKGLVLLLAVAVDIMSKRKKS